MPDKQNDWPNETDDTHYDPILSVALDPAISLAASIWAPISPGWKKAAARAIEKLETTGEKDDD